ncbi:MAG: DUF2264 domain-containing protein [Clostridia bacterium]|nr:DUF2264 domain-containing protein [Clostridia bacterium]
MLDLKSNPLITRQDAVRAAVDMLKPLVPRLTPGKARLTVDGSGAYYAEDVAGMEGFSRALWALVPMLMGKCPEAEPFWQLWREGIANGVDPAHPEYWGDIGDYDQRMVEMAVMGTGLCFCPERFWAEFGPAQQNNLYRWLNQINLHVMPANNWRFFRILVNLGFLKTGRPVNEARLEEDLGLMESFYVGDGWYFDAPTKRDYYTLWGFHFYSLLYAAAMQTADPERCRRFVERARLIAPRFACWFDREGRALPYGRSLTYRFCQGSYWSAMAFAGVTAEGLDLGELKGFLLRNLRFWLRMPIFDWSGALTVGYGYPNLCAAEGYNAPGSPYWGLKTFFALALPKEHPFWQAEEKPYTPPAQFLDGQAHLLICRDEQNRQAVAYTAGNHAWEHMHEDEKYEKFAYSTQFAFSVTKEAASLSKGAFDSMLAVRRTGKDLWHGRSGCGSFAFTRDSVTFSWSPVVGVEIDTVIAPRGMWHVRKHVIRTAYEIEAAEGAFSVQKDWAGSRPCERIASRLEADESRAAAYGAYGSSAIFALRGYDQGEVIHTEPNTNLMYPRCVLPTLHARLLPGEHILICAVFTDAQSVCPKSLPPEVQRLAEEI